MRERQKNQIQNRIRQLDKVHKEIKRRLEECDTDRVKELLEQCQQSAVILGQTIEVEEGEGTAAVHVLEEYCEQVYQIYVTADMVRTRGNIKHIYKVLDGFLARLEDAVRDIRVRREAVFLPYKASMWDSLESIWLAAAEDPDCDAYVIPIPYFDRKADGTVGEIHEEADLYPDYVKVTDYRAYDFQSRRPDLIFIHNPYDHCNFVTSVHPFFYAKNLKQFTDRLVYVPYFVLEEIRPDDQSAVKAMEHFCMVPGVLLADRVIVQSEAMRRVYMEVLTRYMADSGHSATDWENRILGLGSPKFDRLQFMKKEKPKIPETWKQYLGKPDGDRKKIVLYNAGLSILLQYEEKMLEKMESVFLLFQKYSAEYTLLWRPHPLTEATLRSMKPSLWERYEKLQERYRRGEWGIYDDTAEIDRAVLLCDAYYGDPSSVVQMCRQVGKIVLIQDVETEVTEKEQFLTKPLTFEALYDDGDCFWFSSFDYNALFQMDKTGRGVRLAGSFPGEAFIQPRAYVSMIKCNEKFYFAPFSAGEIAEYDPQNRAFRKLAENFPLKDTGRKWDSSRFFRAAAVGEKVYFLPCDYPGILCYDTEKDILRCFDDWVDEVEALRASEWGYFAEYEVYKDRLILPCVCADAVVVFDTALETSRVIPMPKTGYSCKYCGICRAGDSYFLAAADGSVWKRNEDMEEEACIRLPAAGIDEMEYYPVRCTGEWIWLFPFRSGKGMRIHAMTGQVEEETWLNDEREYEGEHFNFPACAVDGKKLYAVTGNSRRFIKYDPLSREKQETKLFLPERDRRILEEKKREAFITQSYSGSVREDAIFSVVFLLEVLRYPECFEKMDDGGENPSAGKRIYETLISE